MTNPLVFCSKSEWEPPIRREHAWATLAAEHGHDVTFVERPRDIRSIRRSSPLAYIRQLTSQEPACRVTNQLQVRSRTTLVPGHRSSLAAAANAALLSRVLARASAHDASIVFSWPWDWPAVRHAPARRKVFDMADDWGELMPGRRARFARYYADIAEEADEIIVVSPDLEDRFGGRRPHVIRNGVFERMLSGPFAEVERATMIYVGTLTPRFDAELMLAVLDALPEWRLELVGACQYPGLGDAPSDELRRLLDRDRRVRWHGAMPRESVVPLLDRAAVAVVPNRPERSLGQDSMKFYDYAARGRPIVSTRWFDVKRTDHPPHLLLADSPAEFARSLLAAQRQGGAEAQEQRAWAATHTWTARWTEWSLAVFGPSVMS